MLGKSAKNFLIFSKRIDIFILSYLDSKIYKRHKAKRVNRAKIKKLTIEEIYSEIDIFDRKPYRNSKSPNLFYLALKSTYLLFRKIPSKVIAKLKGFSK